MAKDKNIVSSTRYALICAWVVLMMMVGIVFVISNPSWFAPKHPEKKQPEISKSKNDLWHPPDTASIPSTPDGQLILYGRELVSHTSVYLGPKRKVKAISNGMNCQNCHLKAGTVPFGNNYSAVASTYPKLRPRSGTVESIEKRVNDCIERSLNGKKIEDESKEMRALVSYIKWVGKDVPKDSTPKGAGLWRPIFLERSADSVKGKIVYQNQCTRCHGQEGKGVATANGMEWKYPPLNGKNSFSIGAGLFRISRFAGYVKANMPSDLATYEKPVLSDEEAWDVSAYVLSLPRPEKDLSKDWPDISKKPVDHPFGPYADRYSETQHKYGPFTSIRAAQKKSK